MSKPSLSMTTNQKNLFVMHQKQFTAQCLCWGSNQRVFEASTTTTTTKSYKSEFCFRLLNS